MAVKVDWTGVGGLTLQLERAPASGAKVYGVAVVRPDGSTWTVVFQSSGILGNADCLVVRTDATGSVQDSCGPSVMQRTVFPPASDGKGGRVALIVSEEDGDQPGVWTLMVWQAFRPSWERPGFWTLSGEGEVLGVTTGDRAFVVTAPDFENGHVVAASFAGAFVSANVGSSLAFEVEDVLFGIMTPDSVGGRTPGMSLLGPLGTQTCACRFLTPLPSAIAVPGSYVVELDRVGGGLQMGTEATVFVMDVKLPP